MNVNKESLFSLITEKISNSSNGSPLIIAIDGRSASGKTTFAKRFENEKGVFVIHTDDFYRPKNSSGLLEISEFDGNFDIKRFKSEVVDNLKKDRFTYGVFDCSCQKVTETVSVCSPKCIIVEGAYGQNPNLTDYANIKVFFDIDEETQKKRIIVRNGEAGYQKFKNIWIQAEERYFNHYKIKENTHYIVMEEYDGNF